MHRQDTINLLVGPLWNDGAQHSMDNLKEAILSDPCLMRFNHKRLIVLRTDFSSRGFGFVVSQPGTDESSEAAMVAYRSGSDFAFMTKEATGVLRPIAFWRTAMPRKRGPPTLPPRRGLCWQLGHQQESSYVIWHAICLGYRLLCHPVHPLVRRK